jgi:hypothetical protein
MAALGLLLSAAAASATCRTDANCSLNGVCSSGVCKCDAPWRGATCAQLEFLPAHTLGAYGRTPNVSSWGASLLGPAQLSLSSGAAKPGGAAYHLFAAQMQTGGLIGWGSQSQCVHAVASSAAGPFTLDAVLVGTECHGPVALPDRARNRLLLFHQGAGAPPGNTSAQSSFMHSAPLDAPFTSGAWLAAPSSRSPSFSCGMPTAAFHPNGTLFMVCGNGNILVSAPSSDALSEEWRKISSPSWASGPGSHGWEDPTLWFDRRGNWHVIFHVFSLTPYAAHHELYSGHAFSQDGILWRWSTEPQFGAPFNGTQTFVAAPTTTYATRERPQMVFASEKRTTPVGMTSSVSSQPVSPACNTCHEGACSQCKITPGRDWTYTIYGPLRTASSTS